MTKNRQIILFWGDCVAFILSFVLMLLVRFSGDFKAAFGTHRGPFLLLFVVWLLVLFIFDFYDLKRVNPNPRNIGRFAIAFLTNTVIGIILFYFFPYFGITPKITLAITSIFSFILIITWRRLFYKIFTSYFTRQIILVGDSPAIHRFADEVKRNPTLGHIVAIWKDGYREAIPEQEVNLLISENAEPAILLATANKLQCTGISLVKAYEELFGKIPPSLMTEERAMEIISRSDNIGYTLLRRLLEVLVALFVLFISSPFLALAIICILIETGNPIFYTQMRAGKNGQPFRLYKLRSMVYGAEKESGAVWAEEKDPRITKVGRIIRKLHIDEIPQMINILKGDITLVGPRPERPKFVEDLSKQIPYYFLRQTIKPGFTGWAQIKFRYARTIMDSEEKFEYDLYYVKNRNLFLDLGILLKTVQIIFTH